MLQEHLDIKNKLQMKKIILILITTLNLFCFVACQGVDNTESLSKINSYIKNSSNYKLLTTGYHFKLYADGVGKDLTKPITNDTIIILKNYFSNKYPVSKINEGKIILLDSTAICNLSYDHDQKKQVMRSFLLLSYENESKNVKLDIKSWVPQYNQGGYKCIEIPND